MFYMVKLQFTDLEDTNLYNILTYRLFEDNVKRAAFLSIHVKGKQLFKEFINERVRRKSTINIWAPLRKARLKGMKNSNTKAHYISVLSLVIIGYCKSYS